MNTASALARPVAAVDEPVRLELAGEHEAAVVCRLTLQHAAARRPVHCFVARGSTRALAFRLAPERNGGTQLISPSFRLSGSHASVDLLEDAVEKAIGHALRDLEGGV